MSKISLKTLIPLVILLVVLITGAIYYTRQNDDEKNVALDSSNNSLGIVLGNNDSASTADLSNDLDKITVGKTYTAKISEIRQPINQGFQDLSEKAKYTTLFSQEEIQNIIDETRKNIESGIDTLKNLALDKKFQTANDQHLQSLNLLLEAINSYDSARQQTDKKEAQRLSELYSYDIEQSNNILKTIQIPN